VGVPEVYDFNVEKIRHFSYCERISRLKYGCLMCLAVRFFRCTNSVLLAACAIVTSTMDSTGGFRTVRLSQMAGDAGKTNDVVFCGHRCPADSNVIFFTGDVQVDECYERFYSFII